jgi:hypothetical protein
VGAGRASILETRYGNTLGGRAPPDGLADLEAFELRMVNVEWLVLARTPVGGAAAVVYSPTRSAALPTDRYAMRATRQAAMQAFARSWQAFARSWDQEA